LERLEVRSLLSGIGLSVGGVPPIASHNQGNTATELVLEAPRSVQVGVPTTVQLVAATSRGIIVSTFSDSVALTSSDAKATLPGSISFSYGVATFSVTFNTAGADTLTATDTTNSAIAAPQATINVVNPAVATQLAFLLPRSVQAGVPVTVVVEALNAQDNIVQNFSDPVSVTSTDTAATLPGTANPASFSYGVATFSVTFNSAGSQMLTVTDTATGSKLSGTAATNVIAPLVATQLQFASLPSKVQSGAAYTVQLKALNAQGVPVQNFNDTVTIGSSDTKATLPGSISFVDGIATFPVTFNTAGSQTLTAADSTNTKLGATAKTTVSGATTPVPKPVPPANPAPSTTTSSNWAGYAAETNLNNPQTGSVTAVSGSWVVPAVTGSGTSYSAVWVGIDGYTSTTVEQIGTESDVNNGTPSYYAWYEMYPQGSMNVALAVKAGDSITASVDYVGSQFVLTITDANDPAGSNSFTTSASAPQAQRSSAEWIVEAPSSERSVLPLADFGTVAFSNATATINGQTGPINNSAYWQDTAINIVSSVTQTSITGLTNANSASSFTVTWLSSGGSQSGGGGGGGWGGGGGGGGGWGGYFSPMSKATLLVQMGQTSTVSSQLAGGADQAVRDQVFASFDDLRL
jgi:hypothetical protein